MDFLPHTNYFASAGLDKTIKIWDVTNGICVKNMIGHSKFINCISCSYNGKYIASAGYDENIKIWDVNSCQCIQTIDTKEPIFSLDYSRNGKYLISSNRTIKLWNISTKKCLREYKGHTKDVMTIRFSPSCNEFASGGYDNTLKVWNISTGNCIYSKEINGAVNSIDYSPNGKYIAVGNSNNTISIHFAKNGKILHILNGHISSVESVKFSQDGKYIVSGSKDQNIKIWDVATGKCVQTLRGHRGSINSVLFMQNERIITGGGDNTIKIWRFPSVESIINRLKMKFK